MEQKFSESSWLVLRQSQQLQSEEKRFNLDSWKGAKSLPKGISKHVTQIRIFSMNTVRNIRREPFAAGTTRVPLPSGMHDEAEDWLQQYALSYRDLNPDSKDCLFPYNTKRCSVWNKYRDEQAESMKPSLAKSTFLKMWKKNFPHVKIRKGNFNVSNKLRIYNGHGPWDKWYPSDKYHIHGCYRGY